MFGLEQRLYLLVAGSRPPYPDWLDGGGQGEAFERMAADYLALIAGYEAGAARLDGGGGEDLAAEPIDAFRKRIPRWQAIANLVSHGTYHRGQVASMVRQLGGKPADSDLIRYYFEQAGLGWPPS